MKILKWLLGTVLALVAVLLLGGLLLPPGFSVVRSTVVAAPADKVYTLVADPRGWKQWSVWNRRDPAMQITYAGPPSGTDAVWEWKSATEGDGRMRFTTAVPGQRVAYDLFFPDFGTTSRGDFVFATEGSGTKVTWTMNGDIGKNPLFRWMGLFADRMVGQDFEAGLTNLKALAEAK
ncbi:MAG: SRPBCC family protein [Rubrivivax sp.]